MIKNPVISVVMPLYDKEKEVLRAIQSVVDQTFDDFELIIVNDGSTDKGPEIARSINDPRIYIIDQANAGVSAARNRGIKESQADLIAFLDADDEWKSEYLETIIDLKNKYYDCDVYATNYLYFNSKKKKYNEPVIKGIPDDFFEGVLENYFDIAAHSDPPLWTSAVSVSKEAIESIGGFPVGVTSGEDLLIWAKLAFNYRIAYSKKPLAIFWMPLSVSERPGRLNNRDAVEQELSCMINSASQEKVYAIKKYAALWHRMSASIYLRTGERQKALAEIQKAISLSGMNITLVMYRIVAIMPGVVSRILTSLIGIVKQLRRRVSSLLT